jgi:hypothetical protein
LEEQVNPGHVDPLKDFFDQYRVATLPDGTPIDRSRGWEPTLSPWKLSDTDFPAVTEAAIRYLPVTRGDVVLGYLWASVADDAADSMERADAGEDGWNAGGIWVPRLREAANEGLTPLQALRKWKGAPEDPRGGAIKADAQEQEAPSLQALKELAGQQHGPGAHPEIVRPLFVPALMISSMSRLGGGRPRHPSFRSSVCSGRCDTRMLLASLGRRPHGGEHELAGCLNRPRR